MNEMSGYENTKDKLIIECPFCNQRISLPKNRGQLEVTCPICKNCFEEFTGERVGRKSKALKRDITFLWAGEYCQRGKKLKYAFGKYNKWRSKNSKIEIVIDGKGKGEFDTEDSKVIRVSNDTHTLAISAPVLGKYKNQGSITIPADDRDCRVLVHQDDAYYRLCAAPAVDPFVNELMNFIERIMKKDRGIKDRMFDSSNIRKELTFVYETNCLRIEYNVDKAKGIREFVSGVRSEKILYKDVGITSSPNTHYPNYWQYITLVISYMISNEFPDYVYTLNNKLYVKKISDLY